MTGGHRKRSTTISHAVAFALLIAAIVLVPFPLASNRPMVVGLLAIFLAGLLFFVVAADFLADRAMRHRLRRGWPALLAFLMLLALMSVQRVDWGSGPISVDPHYTLLYMLMTIAYACVFTLILLVVNDSGRLRLLALALIASGLLQAVIAILLHSAQARYSLFFFDVDHGNYATGMFSYRNSLANYLLMCICLGIGILMGSGATKDNTVFSLRELAAGLVRFSLSKAMLLRLVLVVMVIALVLTRSRMGNAALIMVIVMVALPMLFAMGRVRKRTLVLLASFVVLDILIVGNLVGVEKVVDRIQQTPILQQEPGSPASEESLEARSSPGLQALSMVAERPLLGFGAGGFYAAFPRFALPQHVLSYDHAHNDVLQIAAEMGLIGLALMAALLMVSLYRALAVIKNPYSPLDRGLAFGVILALIAALIHALVDFHLQIPANALTFVVLLGLAWVIRPKTPENS